MKIVFISGTVDVLVHYYDDDVLC